MKKNKPLIFLLVYLFLSNASIAQYDTYGRSAYTREWQAYEAHHANVSGSNKSSSSSGSSGNSGYYEPFSFSRYKPKPLTAEEQAAAKKQEEARQEEERQRIKKQKEKDAEWEKELNKFRVARATGNDKSYSFSTRLDAFNLLIYLSDSANKATKGYLAKPAQLSIDDVYYSIGKLYLEVKSFDWAYHYFDKAQYAYINPKQPIVYITGDYIYSIILGTSNYDYAAEQGAKLYKKDNGYASHFAYALFLNNQLSTAVKLYQQEIDRKPGVLTDTIVTRYLTRIIAMEFIQGKNKAAMEVVNKYFDDKLNDEVKAKEIVAGLLAENIDLLNNIYKNYKSPSMYFDIDLLCKLFPDNKKAAEMRYNFGVEINDKEKQKPIAALWNGVQKNGLKDYSLEGYLARASYDRDLEEAKKRLSNYARTDELPEKETYVAELEEFMKFFKTMTNFNKYVEVKDGLLIFYYSVYKPLYMDIKSLRVEYSSYTNSIILKGYFFDSHENRVITEKYMLGEDKGKPKERDLLYALVKKLQKNTKKKKRK